MDLGFETVGNATLIVHDRGPLLITDPWIDGPAYFGSWTFSHEIPAEQRESINKSRYAWISHGHPDHLSGESLAKLKDKKILLPDHVGGRIRESLTERGFDVSVLPDRRWTSLSDRVRVFSLADYNQDGILLVDIDGTLVMNLNDASDRGWGRTIRKIAGKYEKSFLLKLSGYGDADMIHCFDEEGKPIEPFAAKRFPVGKQIRGFLDQFGAQTFIPFSSMHQYLRSDSIWAEKHMTRLEDYPNGFDNAGGKRLWPAFVAYDARKDSYERINPPARDREVLPPEKFGDNWSDSLTREDEKKLSDYFSRFEHLGNHFDFIRFRVGGRETTIDFADKKFDSGVTFEAPRHSLMRSIEWEIFDDMLIGNFMKTTIHGKVPVRPLYPDFTPYVAKYGDNGLARTDDELREYFRRYRRRAPLEYMFNEMETRSVDVFRALFPMDSKFYQFVKGTYHRLKEL